MLTEVSVINSGPHGRFWGGPARGGSPSKSAAGLFSQLFGGRLLIEHL